MRVATSDAGAGFWGLVDSATESVKVGRRRHQRGATVRLDDDADVAGEHDDDSAGMSDSAGRRARP